MFAGGVSALSGSLYMLVGFRAIRKTERVRIDGESGERRVGVMGCGETGHEIW